MDHPWDLLDDPAHSLDPEPREEDPMLAMLPKVARDRDWARLAEDRLELRGAA